MEALYINPEIHQRDLARILVKGTANLSRDLEKLENKGLIKRLAGTREKRIVKTLMLTSEGERIYQEVSGRIYNHISEIENIFSKEEREQFLFLISKLQNRLTESSDMIYD